MLIAPDKEAAILYVMFLGYYPILKSVIERIKKPVLEWAVKLLIFNAAVIAAYAIIIHVITTGEDMNVFGKYTVLVLLALGNVTFVVYDFALSKLVTAYLVKFRKILFKKIIK